MIGLSIPQKSERTLPLEALLASGDGGIEHDEVGEHLPVQGFYSPRG